MGGKAALFLVLGFSMIMLVVGNNFTSLTNRSLDNFTKYYKDTQAYNIAVSGANMAANQIFWDRSYSGGYSNVSFSGGTLTVTVSNNTSSTGTISQAGKTLVCHRGTTLSLPNGAVAAHLAHGDVLGACGGTAYDATLATIVSEGTFMNVTKTVIVVLQPSSFAKFGNYYSSISALPATGDTFHGPFHTNGRLDTWGTPVFLGKVTTRNGLRALGSPPNPQFLGGYQSGVDIPLNFDTTNMRSNADVIFRNTANQTRGVNVRLYFNANGTVTYQTQNEGSSSWTAAQTTALTTLAPNGVLYADKGNIYTKGTVNGALTIVANKNGRNGYGNVYQEDQLQYAANPINGYSDDMLGIIATENIRIQDNVNTRGRSIITQASMFAMNGNIRPEDGLITQNFLGDWHILGGLIASTTGVTATYSGSTPVRGLRFNHRYDNRFLLNVPPSFPQTKNFEVVSWYE